MITHIVTARPFGGSQLLPSESLLRRADCSFHVADVTVWNRRPDLAGRRVEAVQRSVVGCTTEFAVNEVFSVDQIGSRHRLDLSLAPPDDYVQQAPTGTAISSWRREVNCGPCPLAQAPAFCHATIAS